MVTAPVRDATPEAAAAQSVKTGLAETNQDVQNVITCMLGRDIIINTFDGKRYRGIFTSISPTQQMGFEMLTEITEKNRLNLLRAANETEPKVFFEFDQIVDYVFPIQEDKAHEISSKFVTDRQYHGDVPSAAEDLEAWCGGEDDDGLGGSIEDQEPVSGPPARNNRRGEQNNGGGWSADAMFAANEAKVVSTFKEDLTQYTTVAVNGTEEDWIRADKLAQEIESSQSSKFYANLENDDVERDLDKTTNEDDFENGNNRRKGNNNQQSQQRRNQNPNITPNGQPVNRRAEGLRGDRRNSGSSGNNGRYGPSSSQNYQSQQHQKGGYNNGNRRQNEDYRENDWQMAKGKGQNQGNDSSFRHQQKQMLDPRPTPKQSTNEGEKTQGSTSRVTDLKNWRNDFDMATSPKEQSPAPVGNSQPTSGSAWTRGPPSSLVAKGSSAESTPPPPETDVAPVVPSPSKPEKREETPSTSGEGQDSVDGKQSEGDNMSTTGASETSTSKKLTDPDFKFNINAPEFKPRVAPTTPTPTTPTGHMPHNGVMTGQFIPNDYHQQGMVPQGVPLMQHHIAQGGPQGQGHQIVMWQQGQQGGFNPNQQAYPMQQVGMPGVPGQMYGPAATAPATVQNNPNQQVSVSAAGGPQPDVRSFQPARREGEYVYPFSQSGPVVVPQQFFHQQAYPGGMQSAYPLKVISQQGPGQFQRFPPQVYIGQVGPQGQRFQGGPPPNQQQQFGEQGGPQSHPNSQPTTPGPRGEQNGPKAQHGQQSSQNGSNNNAGMHRGEPENGSSASLSGSNSSQSGQRSGTPPNAGAVPQAQQPQQQVPPHLAQPQGQMMAPPGHMNQYMVMHPQMHAQIQNPYYPQQNVYYPFVPQMQMANQQNQQSVMGERADQGFPQPNVFDYRTMNMYQPQHPQQQMHGGHMSRQNSLPQQFGGNQGQQGVNPSSQAPTPVSQQQGQSREQQQPPSAQ